MEPFPSVPPISAAPDGLLEGHLWLLEAVEGLPLRFQVRSSGRIRFGDRTRVYDRADDLPAPYRRAVRQVRESFDRDALREAVESTAAVTFSGTATVRRRLPYDFERLPPFLGCEVRSASGAFRPPDAAAGIFDRLGLTPINAFERELPARDFSPERYAVPSSAWYDGPAAGVVVRNKRGHRGRLAGPPFADTSDTVVASADTGAPIVVDAADLAAPTPPHAAGDAPTASSLATDFVTDARLAAVAADLDTRTSAPTIDAIVDRLVERAFRERPRWFTGVDPAVEPRAFRSAVASLVADRRSTAEF